LIPTRWRIFFSSKQLSPARQFFKDSRNVHRTLRIEHCLLHNCPEAQWICTRSVRDIQRDPQCIGDIWQHRRWQLKREGCRESRLRNGSKQSSASTGEELRLSWLTRLTTLYTLSAVLASVKLTGHTTCLGSQQRLGRAATDSTVGLCRLAKTTANPPELKTFREYAVRPGRGCDEHRSTTQVSTVLGG